VVPRLLSIRFGTVETILTVTEISRPHALPHNLATLLRLIQTGLHVVSAGADRLTLCMDRVHRVGRWVEVLTLQSSESIQAASQCSHSTNSADLSDRISATSSYHFRGLEQAFGILAIPC
jgi:hypothetical protein